jgi:hypothetical protein
LPVAAGVEKAALFGVVERCKFVGERCGQPGVEHGTDPAAARNGDDLKRLSKHHSQLRGDVPLSVFRSY